MESDDDADLFRCAICNTSEADSSNLNQSSLQTNAAVRCGHQFCMPCVERELSRRKEFPCPICETPVKKVTLSTRTLDEVQCEKDTHLRRRVLKVYNKVQRDFTNLEDYNNYLEEVEDIIYSIVNEESNAEECKAKLKKYEEENKSQIVIRQSRRADADRDWNDRIAAEQREKERRKREALQDENAITIAKRRYKLEATQVTLGEREEVSRELIEAQISGYRSEILKQRGHGGQGPNYSQGSRVREPAGGLRKDKKINKEEYLKRQAAGGGIPVRNTQTHDRNWKLAVSSLFVTHAYMETT